MSDDNYLIDTIVENPWCSWVKRLSTQCLRVQFSVFFFNSSLYLHAVLGTGSVLSTAGLKPTT